jgi:digeranylgeranylglycerophospholipid reductase
MEEYDVLVVGAGPAGSGAALSAAMAGAKTLMVDRKKEIGTPVQCGEVIGRSLLRQTGIVLPRQAICSTQRSTRFLIDRSLVVNNREDYWASVTVERKILDKLWAEDAARAGARVEADTKLTSLDLDGEDVVSATIMRRGREVKVRPKMVVAADGVHSIVAKLMGVRWYPEEYVARGAEFELVAKRPLPKAMQIILEPEVGLGYGWIIPKGSARANVGMAEVGASAKRRSKVMDWIEEHPLISKYFDTDKVLEVKTGEAPVPGFKGGPTKGNVLFAGDAAGQTLAFVGEGIVPSHVCGRVAGAAAAMGDPSVYDSQLREVMGEELDYGSRLKDEIIALWNDPSLSPSERVMVSGLVMSECIQPEELMMLEAMADAGIGEMLTALREKLKEEKRGITVSRIRGRDQ